MWIFLWDDETDGDGGNTAHVAAHGVTPGEAEYIVTHATPPFPRSVGDGKHLVWGQLPGGDFLQVVFAYKGEDRVEFESLSLAELDAVMNDEAVFVYVVHAMPMTEDQKRQYRKL